MDPHIIGFLPVCVFLASFIWVCFNNFPLSECVSTRRKILSLKGNPWYIGRWPSKWAARIWANHLNGHTPGSLCFPQAVQAAHMALHGQHRPLQYSFGQTRHCETASTHLITWHLTRSRKYILISNSWDSQLKLDCGHLISQRQTQNDHQIE